MSRRDRLRSGGSTRRTFLKAGSSVGIVTLFAGCTGGDGGGGADGGGGGDGGGGDGGSTPTESPTGTGSTEEEELSPEDWRKEKARAAEEELSGDEQVLFDTNSSIPPGIYPKMADGSAFEGTVYEALGKVNVKEAGDEVMTRYAQAQQAKNDSFDVLDHTSIATAIISGVPAADVSNIPGYQNQHADFQVNPKVAFYRFQAAGCHYNTDLVDDPPQTYDDFMADRFSGGKIVLDFTPGPMSTAAMIERKGLDWMREFANKQEPEMIGSSFGMSQNVGKGDYHLAFLGLSALGYLMRNGKDLPLDVVLEPELNTLLGTQVTVAKYPKHPNAAELLFDWVMNNETIQAGQDGLIGTDLETASPDELAATAQEMPHTTPFDFDQPINEMMNDYRDAIGAPTV